EYESTHTMCQGHRRGYSVSLCRLPQSAPPGGDFGPHVYTGSVTSAVIAGGCGRSVSGEVQCGSSTLVEPQASCSPRASLCTRSSQSASISRLQASPPPPHSMRALSYQT